MRSLSPGAQRKLAVAAALSVAAATALLLIYGYGPQFLHSFTADRDPPSSRASGAAAGAPSPLELSVFDEPRPMPAIRFTDAENRELTLVDFRGRLVLLNIWATWCVPCREEMPSLDRLEKKLGGEDFTVLPLSIDRRGVSVIKPFYQELGLQSLGIYLDSSGTIQGALGIPGIPTSLLIDREGREVARKMGAAKWDGPDMLALIRRYLPPASGDSGKQGR